MNTGLANNRCPNPSIIGVLVCEHGLDVKFSNGNNNRLFSWFWLKDHGVDEESLDPETMQRRVDTFGISKHLQPDKVDFDHSNQEIQLFWNDGSFTLIPSNLLLSVTGQIPSQEKLLAHQPKRLWDKDNKSFELPSISFDEVISSDQGLYKWLKNIQEFGFSLVLDVPPTKIATECLAKSIGLVEQTIFGEMWELSAQLDDHGDSAYTTQYLEPHTDSTYYHDAPGLQMFNCLEFDGKGGESVLVDGFAIAEKIKSEDPDAYRTLTEVIVPGQYLEPGVHLYAEREVFRLNSQYQLAQISFNNYDRAPFLLTEDTMQRFYRAYNIFHDHVINQDNWLKIPLRPGMTLIFDNWRTLHGRMGYVGKRVFYGCYHNRAEFESKLRILQTKFQTK